MVTNLQTVIPSQDILYAVDQVIVARLSFDSPASVSIGGLPAGAIPIAATFSTQTAFNAATTNNINVGFTDATATTANAYVAAGAIGPVGPVQLTLATTGVPLSRATTVTMAYSQTGTAATAGVGYL